MSHISDLRRAFYLAMPCAFGKDIWKDLGVIKALEQHMPATDGTAFSQAFSSVMGSVEEFFSGNDYCPSEELRICRRLGHLDSGLAKAFGTCDLEAFLSRREAFLEQDDRRAELEEAYRLGVEDVAFRANDPQIEEPARDRAIRAGVHLVLLAHEDQARLDGRPNEVIVAGKLANIMAVTEGMQSGWLTRKIVYDGLKVAADECAGLNGKTIAAGIENEFLLRGMA
ncbi:MAG: hypothetical protein H6862_01465 [Rhodospirillales bacterium]|nr:hypothetical protein [Rhodospirillales bacterium]